MSLRNDLPGTTRRTWCPVCAFGAALLLAALAVTLTGCAWTGKGRDVAQALQKSGALKTAAYSGSIQMEATGQGLDESIEITFVGANDTSDPAHPKSTIDMTVMNERIKAVVPGDGNTYMETRDGAFGAPTGPSGTENQAELGRVFAALESAIGNFRDGRPEKTKEGTQLKSIIADGKIDEICGNVVPTFSGLMSTASSDTGALKELGGDTKQICRRLLLEKPTIWFGLDSAGFLRMIAVRASMSLLGMGKMTMTMRFDITSMNEPVKIERPAGARMLASEAALQQQIAAGTAR